MFNLSHEVIAMQTQSGMHVTVEDVESRRRRREDYIRVICDLVNAVRNAGFNAQQFENALDGKGLVDITLHRHNDIVETFTAAARRHGIVFFLGAKDMYYVDDLHARAWCLPLRPRNSKVTAGSGRGLKQLLRKKGQYLISKYGMNTAAKSGKVALVTDEAVSAYNKDVRSRSQSPQSPKVTSSCVQEYKREMTGMMEQMVVKLEVC